MNLTEIPLHSKLVFDGILLKVYRDQVAMPDGQEKIREMIKHPGAAVIVPHLGDNRFVLVRQYRYALKRETLEFPAGRIDNGEDPQECARRELTEETGYQAGKMEPLFQIHPAPGYSDELLWIFKASDLVPGFTNPDPDELVTTVEMSLDELVELFRKCEITDSKTVNAIMFLKCF